MLLEVESWDQDASMARFWWEHFSWLCPHRAPSLVHASRRERERERSWVSLSACARAVIPSGGLHSHDLIKPWLPPKCPSVPPPTAVMSRISGLTYEFGGQGRHTNIQSIALSPESPLVWKPSDLQVAEILIGCWRLTSWVLPRTCLKEAASLKCRSTLLGRWGVGQYKDPALWPRYAHLMSFSWGPVNLCLTPRFSDGRYSPIHLLHTNLGLSICFLGDPTENTDSLH